MAKTEKKAEVVSIHGAVPAHLRSQIAKDSGKGVSTDQADNLVPLIYILQALSPQVNKRNPNYIEGAEAGDIWLRNSPDPIVKGDSGLIFQPCYFSKDWVEWVPRDSGGGFVGRHRDLPGDTVKKIDDKNPNKSIWVRKNGNEMKETRYHVGFVITNHGPVPYVIPMSSSGHTTSRNWMFMMNSKTMEDGSKVPSFACLYLLKTKERTNAAGTWAVWDVSDAGWVASAEDYARGLALYDAFASGAKEAAVDEAGEDADDGKM